MTLDIFNTFRHIYTYTIYGDMLIMHLMKQPTLHELIPLCKQLIASNNQSIYQLISPILTDINSIPAIIMMLPQSNELMFTFTTILTKSIESNSFVWSGQTKSEQEGIGQSIQLQKVRVYASIMRGIFQVIIMHHNHKSITIPAYIIKSALNLMSVCIKTPLQCCTNPTYLHPFLQVLLPQFTLNPIFTSNYNNDLMLLVPQATISPVTYPYAIAVLKGLIEYVLTSAYYRTYYQYRRNVYTFRNAYLALLLNAAFQYTKLIAIKWKTAITNPNPNPNPNQQQLQQIVSYLNETLSLFQAIVMYPFTLNLHEYDNEDELSDTSTSDVYFPNWFRHVLCDRQFLQFLVTYFVWLVQNSNDIRPQLLSIVKIVSRMACASSYAFNSDNERLEWRSCMITVINEMAIHCSSHGSSSGSNHNYYLQSLADVFNRCVSHLLKEENEFKLTVVKNILTFALGAVTHGEIKLEDGRRNPFCKAFQIANTVVDQCKGQVYEEELLHGIQVIMQTAIQRILSPQESGRILKDISKQIEIQCFQQLYQSIPPIFKESLQINLKILAQLNIAQLTKESATCLLHLCAKLLPSHHANMYQTNIILKYYDAALSSCSLAALKYMHTLVSHVLMELTDGFPTTQLWRCIQQIRQESFQSFILNIIKQLITNFTSKDGEIIDYSLQIFKCIYTKLKKYDNPRFQSFYSLIHTLLQQISHTSLSLERFSSKRIAFFSIVSTIWLSRYEYTYLYDIYSVISSVFNNGVDCKALVTYMHDVTGLMEPIQWHQTFQVVAELAINDLKVILPQCLPQQGINQIFADYRFLKSFLKMVQQFVNDASKRVSYQTQCDLPLEICDLFYPYIKLITSPQLSSIQIPKCIIQILYKLPALNPLLPLIPLYPHLSDLNSPEMPSLLTQYFNNLSRLQDLMSIYPFIQSSVDHLIEFWEEAISRNQRIEGVQLKTIVQARIWTNKRQKQSMAKLIWMIGRLDLSYWDIRPYPNQKKFVQAFMEKYII